MIHRYLQPIFASVRTSPRTRSLRRALYEIGRRACLRPREAQVYLRLDDPYSLLLAQVLPELADRFSVRIRPRVVSRLDPAMYPDIARFECWALRDATNLAALYRLAGPGTPPLDAGVASLRLAEFRELGAVRQFFLNWWRGGAVPHAVNSDRARAEIAANERALHAGGHYQSAVIFFGGEWYWGLDRLDHLERRWIAAGLAHATDDRPRFVARHRFLVGPPVPAPTGEPLVLYWSACSPYAYLALERCYRLADHYSVQLDIRPVLPMMMRNLPVPRAKRLHILLDAKREAETEGIPLGRVCDPAGEGVERCYGLFAHARACGRVRELVLSFSRAV